MPKSRLRKNRSQASQEIEKAPLAAIKESPRWLAPLMVIAFLVGLAWIVVFYVSGSRYPIPNIGSWNMLVGFVFVGVGFTLATRWQ